MSSRKGTKAWRKNISVQNVEDSIEQQSKDQMAGGAIELKPTEELFKLDSAGTTEVVVKPQKRLRVDEILAERSQVPAVCKFVKAQLSKEKSRQVTRQVLQQAKKIKIAPKKVAVAKEPSDIWAIDSKPLVKVPDTVRNVPAISKLPAIDRVCPGQSYNPDTDSHQKVLQEAYDVEVERLQHKDDLLKNAPSQQTIIRNHNVDAHFTMDIVLEEGDEEELPVEIREPDAPLDSKPKTQTQKNRMIRHKEIMLKHAKHRMQKKLDQSHIELENADTETLLQDRKLRLKEKAKLTALRDAKETKQMSKYRFNDMPVALKLTDELPENLRSLTPEQSPFKERFSSLQKRNIIEVRQPVMQRRRFSKRDYEVHSYKKFV